MMKRILCCFAATLLLISAYPQEDSLKIIKGDSLRGSIDTAKVVMPFAKAKYPVYRLRAGRDIPIFAIGAAWSGYAFTKIYSKDTSTTEEILSLDKNDINRFDRWAVRPYSEETGKVSDFIFYGSMGLPFLFLIDHQTRKDFFKLSFLYLEAMSITGLLYTGSVYLTDRYRPYSYSDETPMEWRRRGGAKNSFYAGHVALVATSTFFMAKVYNDYYPDSKIKWLMFSAAGIVTGTAAYLRHRGGFHFPTDLILGVTQGTLTGILVPHFHKNKSVKDPSLTILPYSYGDAKGLSLVYTIKKRPAN